MWWIVLMIIFTIGLIVRGHGWSNMITRHKKEMHRYRCEYDVHDWNGYRWYDGYNLHE